MTAALSSDCGLSVLLLHIIVSRYIVVDPLTLTYEKAPLLRGLLLPSEHYWH